MAAPAGSLSGGSGVEGHLADSCSRVALGFTQVQLQLPCETVAEGKLYVSDGFEGQTEL